MTSFARVALRAGNVVLHGYDCLLGVRVGEDLLNLTHKCEQVLGRDEDQVLDRLVDVSITHDLLSAGCAVPVGIFS